MIAVEFTTSNKKGNIKIPEEFKIKENADLKVIILYENDDKKENNLVKILLDGPTLTEKEIEQFNQVNEEFKKWQIKGS